MTLLLIYVCVIVYACVITWWYDELDGRWIRLCHTLGLPSRTPPDEVFDELITVVAQSQIIDNDFEEVDGEDDVEPNPPIQE